MKPMNLSRIALCGLTLALCGGCGSSDEIDQPRIDYSYSLEKQYPETIHVKERDLPYPRLQTELYLNPSPLIVPQALKKEAKMQFELSQDYNFEKGEVIRSEARAWCLYNPHRRLDAGRWYWRFRSVADDGTVKPWSDVVPFEVKPSATEFVTPPFAAMQQNLPAGHPRLYPYLDEGLEAARRGVQSHPEYKSLVGRANNSLGKDHSAKPYAEISNMKRESTFLYTAYRLTLDERYAAQLLENLRALLNTPVDDATLFASNFGATDIAICIIEPYDLLWDRLTEAERTAADALMMRIAERYFAHHCGKQENTLFDNHFWQHNMRVLFQCAYMLYDRPDYADRALEMMEYYYELWTARAPDSGFNHSGVWRNGAYYFDANIQTLHYMPMLYGYLTGCDFLQHPWYRSAGQALAYTWPPQSMSAGFGDGADDTAAPTRIRVAFADFLARELNDSYAGWYAGQCPATLADDYQMRLYRIVRGAASYSEQLPAEAPRLLWYRDAGEVVMHSDMTSPAENLTLSFRSSPFGSGSHTQSDQNSFNILYGGQPVYRRTGYYLNFSDAHNITSYRHSRAHNTVLVDGIGQPFSTSAYGVVTRALSGAHILYCLGDASQAYRGGNDAMWVENLKKAGIAETPENGFGPTPLSCYRRHVALLHPNKVVIYDELAAEEPVSWQWLLHSPVRFTIDAAARRVTSRPGSGLSAATQLFSGDAPALSQTDQFVTPPDMNLADPGQECPNQWHLTAEFGPSKGCRVLALMQITPSAAERESIVETPDGIRFGKWLICAELDADRTPSLVIVDTESGARLDYGCGDPTLNGTAYRREQGLSTILYDFSDGRYRIEEQSDWEPATTRSM